MTKIEQMGRLGVTGQESSGPALHVVNRTLRRSANVPVSAARSGLELVPRPVRGRHMGNKGRQVLARRRALDGAFLTVAMGAVVLLWWSTL